MDNDELLQRIRLGEDSQNQFKTSIDSPDSLAAEICAFTNSRGGCLIIGVNDTNTLTEESIRLGIHIERNPILLTFMQKMKNFKYTGRGSGIPR